MWNERAGSPSKNADNGSSKVDRCPPGTREKLVLEDLRGGKFYQERSRGEEFRESIPLAILLRAGGGQEGVAMQQRGVVPGNPAHRVNPLLIR